VPGGLDISNLNLSDGRPSNVQVDMKDGWFLDQNDVRHVQSTHFECGKQKGVKQILIERGMNKHKNENGHVLNFQCHFCKTKTTDAERLRGIEMGYINHKCYMSYVLSHESDFEAQEAWLTQVAHEAGFEIIFYPKYHCELNYIEMVWGWAKSHHRGTCTYNYKNLKGGLPNTFDDLLQVGLVRKF
jgi:hypothetical protein